MGLLAYQPDEVGRLHLAMRQALDELRRMQCHDAAAIDAMRLVRSSAAQLETVWLPLAFRLLTTDPLSGRQRRDAGIGALDQSLIRVMADGYGWSVQTDPLDDDPTVVTPEEARALGAALNGIDPQQLADDPARLAWLAQQLAVIGADPALSREFLANFHNWDTLPYVLGTRRATLLSDGGDGGAGVRGIDGVFDGLAHIWRNTLEPATLAAGQRATVDSLLPDMAAPDPYVQALPLRGLDLDPITLATVTDELLRMWLARKDDGDTWSIDLHQAYGPNTADILLAEIAQDSVACIRFLTLAQDHLDVLFWSLDQPDIAARIVLTATDPANVTAQQAEPLVLAVLEYFRHDPYRTGRSTDGYAGDYGLLLADMVAPWLLQFTPSNRDWAADPARRQSALQIAFDNDDAIDRLIANSQRLMTGFDVTTSPQSAQQVGELINIVWRGAIEARVDDEATGHTHAGWDLLWTIISSASSFLKVEPATGLTIGFGIDWLSGLLGEALLDQPDPAGMRVELAAQRELALTVVAATWLRAWFEQQLADGNLPADTSPPPVPDTSTTCVAASWQQQLDEWLVDLPGGTQGLPALQASVLVGNVLGSGQAADACQEVAS